MQETERYCLNIVMKFREAGFIVSMDELVKNSEKMQCPTYRYLWGRQINVVLLCFSWR